MHLKNKFRSEIVEQYFELKLQIKNEYLLLSIFVKFFRITEGLYKGESIGKLS